MSEIPQKLTRNQLAEFLPNQRAIIAFERLLKQANESIPADLTTLNRLIEETGFTAEEARAHANSIDAQLIELGRKVQSLIGVDASSQINMISAQLAKLGQETQVIIGSAVAQINSVRELVQGASRRVQEMSSVPVDTSVYLARLNDVAAAKPSNGDSLQFNAAKNRWENTSTGKFSTLLVNQSAALAGEILSVNGKILGLGSSYALMASNGSGTGQTSIVLRREGAAADEKFIEMMQDGSGNFILRTIDDAYSAATNIITATRSTGINITAVNIAPSVGMNAVMGAGALATNATSGFTWIPSCAGTPTGAPTAPYTNAAALVVDTTGSKLWVLVGSTWKSTSLV